ncbi:MAG: complex I subunit 5 family protein [Dehalococcoidia bacterium]
MAPYTGEMETTTASFLPLAAIMIPAIAAVLVVATGRHSERLRNSIALLATIATFAVVVIMSTSVLRGVIFVTHLGIMRMTDVYSLTLAVDPMGAFFSLIAALLWVAAMAHSYAYMSHEHRRTRFFATLMITEAAILGVFMVRDFLSLFVFFEIMGLAAYFLVVHSEADEARKAATKYLYMAIAGGLSLLMGILLYLNHTGTLSFGLFAEAALLAGPLQIAALGCMIAGFGVKAGIVPLHVWLPDAHPVAPSPASALLSGVMIKAGAYGIIRAVTSFFYMPPPNMQSLGLTLMTIAIATAFIGMVLAIRQSDLKRTLAYSSISQMGFLLIGVGGLAYLGDEGAIGLAGTLYHTINHAMFKGCLFLVAGSILYSVHTTHMPSLGGLWRRMPLTTVAWCIATLGLMGIPLFNGFVSKSLLHHAIADARYLAAVGTPYHVPWLQAVDILYVIIASGTIVYGLKMAYYVFFRAPAQEPSHNPGGIHEAPVWMTGAAGVLAAGVLVLGLAPGFTLRHLVAPVTEMLGGLDSHAIDHLRDLQIYTWYNIKDVLLPLGLGIGAFLAVTIRSRARKGPATDDPFHYPLPRWLSVDRLYTRSACAFVRACLRTELLWNRWRQRCTQSVERSASLCFSRDGVFVTSGQALLRAARDEADSLYRTIGERRRALADEYGDDIALGALFIAISLALFLIFALV